MSNKIEITDKERYQASKRVTIVGMFTNTLLALVKMVVGVLGRSPALFADGIHSLSDLLSDITVLIAAKYASAEEDENHPYGHERIEAFGTMILAGILIAIGVSIGYHAVKGAIMGQYLVPDQWTIYVALFSILANELLFRYTLKTANKIDSDLLRANAWHSRSDMWSSVVVLVGIIGAMLGAVWMDAVAAVLVSAMIVKMGVSWAYHSINELIDEGVDSDTLQKMNDVIASVEGVKSHHDLKTRKMATKILVEVHILVDAQLTASEGHYIAECVRTQLIKNIDEKIKSIVIHVDTYAHAEGDTDVNKLPPSRKTIQSQLSAFLLEKGYGLGNENLEMLIYYHQDCIECVLMLSESEEAKKCKKILEEFSISGAKKTKIRVCFL